jgi:hypothetical protein
MLCTLIVQSSSDLAEERPIDGHVFDCPGSRADAEFLALEKVAQTVAVDEVDRRRAIAGGFLLCVSGERVGSDQQAFVAPACHRAAKVTDRARERARLVAVRRQAGTVTADADELRAALTGPRPRTASDPGLWDEWLRAAAIAPWPAIKDSNRARRVG